VPNRGYPKDPAPVFPKKTGARLPEEDVKEEIVELGGADGEKRLPSGDWIDNLPPLRAQLSGVLAEFVA
jgi:hypothetical protein